jgi:hypothetical protein
LRVASLEPSARVPVYEAALGAAFELNDPALTLMLDPRLLPRAGGMAEDGRLPAGVETGLKQRGVVQGVCEPPITASRKTPHCEARGPGYVAADPRSPRARDQTGSASGEELTRPSFSGCKTLASSSSRCAAAARAPEQTRCRRRLALNRSA